MKVVRKMSPQKRGQGQQQKNFGYLPNSFRLLILVDYPGFKDK